MTVSSIKHMAEQDEKTVEELSSASENEENATNDYKDKELYRETDSKEDENNETESSTSSGIDFSSINYKDFEKVDQEQIDLYYMLNDNKNNIEFLNEDLVAISKKEEEIKALKAKEKEEFDFQMEELVSNGNEIKVDLTGIIDDLEKDNNKL